MRLKQLTLLRAGLRFGFVGYVACVAGLNLTAGNGTSPATNRFTTVEEMCNPMYLQGLGAFRPPSLLPSSPESGPAELDPEGHWGEPCVGWRLSVRLETNRFSPEDLVLVSAILRNVSRTQLYLTLGKTTHSSFCNFEVIKGTNLHASARGRVMLLGPLRVTVPPFTQCRVWARVSLLADFSQPGWYRIRAVAPVPVFDPATNQLLYYTNVVSGWAEFEIVLPREEDKRQH